MRNTDKNIKNIKKITEKYFEIFPEDIKDLKVLEEQLNKIDQEDVFDRKNFHGHVVADSLVINEKGEVLLIFHNFLKKYIQPGGHVDPGDGSVLEAAKRELEEETGISIYKVDDFHSGNQAPILIESHRIPQNTKKEEEEHYHHDFMYVFRVNGSDVVLQEEEVSGFKWIPIEDILENGGDGFVEKALRRMKKIDML